MRLSNSSRITEPRRRRFSAVSNKTHEILGLLLDFEIAVADDPEETMPAHLIAGKQALREHADHGFERDEALALSRPVRREYG